jgi:hypothetical protein
MKSLEAGESMEWVIITNPGNSLTDSLTKETKDEDTTNHFAGYHALGYHSRMWAK